MLQLPIFIFLALIGCLVFLAGWVMMLTRSKNEISDRLRISEFNNDLKDGHLANMTDKVLEYKKIAEDYQNTCDIQHRQITSQLQQIKQYETRGKKNS